MRLTQTQKAVLACLLALIIFSSVIVCKRTLVISPLEIFSPKTYRKKRTGKPSSILMYFSAHTLNVVERVRVYQDYVTKTEHSEKAVCMTMVGRQAATMAAE